MKLSQLVGKRTRDIPRDVTSMSHQFLLRGGYVRPLASGIYSILPLAKRVLIKIEAILREEMERIGGQEVFLPVVMPRELWEESGRYGSIDNIMVRFKDRNQKDFVLGLTHEEAVLALARTEVSSYRQLPFMLYQIQTKFRDELRPRSGLIRVREFTMKDAYSFHCNESDLVSFYSDCYKSYERIFKRVGLKNVRIVQSDTGMMGGAVAHEFMLETAIGEDSLVVCDCCGYSANSEVAVCKQLVSSEILEDLEEVLTPNCRTIQELCDFLSLEPARMAKAVFYKIFDITGRSKLVFCLVRGDKDINEVKLSKATQCTTFQKATDDEIRSIGAEPGYASPINLLNQDNILVLIDHSVANGANFVTGANKVDYHFKYFNVGRDLKCAYQIVDVSSVSGNEPCTICESKLRLSRGIEIGNIFQLGKKYTESMKMSFLDEMGQAKTPFMGCYGIGVGRLMASIIEDSHDDRGPIWDWSVAPFQVHICAINTDVHGVFEQAKSTYHNLLGCGFEVIWDDTNAQPGVQFADADLIGAPIRIIISPRTERLGVMELRSRDGSYKTEVASSEIVSHCIGIRARYAQDY